jgi:putative ABC transport system permease protein
VVRVGNYPSQVVGVLEARGQSGFGQDQDDTLVVPYTMGMKKLKGNNWLDDIMASAVTQDSVDAAIDQIVGLLRERHHLRPGQDDDFNVRRPDDVIQARLEASRTFSILLIAIASVSLLVGGIGIMNVMLVSVTERTREIGIRMAIGATEGSVQAQFLGEAVLLSLFGGLMGVIAGVSGSFLIGSALQWPMSIPPQSIAIAALFASGVGVFFGFYPAMKASHLDPIEALRFE